MRISDWSSDVFSSDLQKYLSPTLIGGTDPEMAISREEIFGPILPVIEYDDISRVIDTINTGPKPLALYIFSKHAPAWESIIERTSSGGVCINQNVVRSEEHTSELQPLMSQSDAVFCSNKKTIKQVL